MHREMVRNAQVGLGSLAGYYLPCNSWECYFNNLDVLAAFGNKVRRDGPWDHKPKLRWRVASEVTYRDGIAFAQNFYTPIRGNPVPERLRYDVWSNIHYGYVGRAHNIPRSVLMDFQRVDGGGPDPADDISIRIGMNLAESGPYPLTKAALQRAIVAKMPAYRRVSTWSNVVVVSGLAP